MPSVPSCCACKPALHSRGIYQARLLELKLTSREHCEIGNAADVVLCCQTREPFSIDLHHNCTPREFAGGLGHLRGGHTARSAPGCPEVRQDRNLALANDLVELLLVDFDGFGYCRQLHPAGTAFADIGKVLGGNAIGSTARGAISNQRHGPILKFSRSSEGLKNLFSGFFYQAPGVKSLLIPPKRDRKVDTYANRVTTVTFLGRTSDAFISITEIF